MHYLAKYIYIYIYIVGEEQIQACKQFVRFGAKRPTQLCFLPSAKAYKVWVGHIFLQCESKSQKLLTLFAKNKTVQVLRPQSKQTACGFGFVPPPCVVMVHSCLQLRLIRHEWSASFFDVGVSLKNCTRRLKEQDRVGPSAPERTNCLEVGKTSSHTNHL